MSGKPLQDEVLWCITPGQALRFREWQGEYVLYNDISGDTHLFGRDAIGLLFTLQAAPAVTSALLSEFGDADRAAHEAGDDAGPSLPAQLYALALIEPVA